MTTTYTRNLRLRISSDMTTDAKANLNIIDGAYSEVFTTMGGTKVFTATNGFRFLPSGGSPGGSVEFGGQTTPLASFRVYGPLTAASLGLQAVTGTYHFQFLPNPAMTQNFSLTMPAEAGLPGQTLMLSPTDPNILVFGSPTIDPVTDERIMEAILPDLFLADQEVGAGDSIETAFGKLQGQLDNLTPLRAMDPGVLVKTNDDGFLTELTEVTPAQLVTLSETAGSKRVSFEVAAWESLTAGLWTLRIQPATHLMGPNVHVSCIADSTRTQVMVNSVSVDVTGIVSLTVLNDPDLRFSGTAVISKAGV
jgi:hypothetical protein